MGAQFILIVGSSGSGKSSSLRYLDPKTTIIITPSPKDLIIPALESKRMSITEITQIGPTLSNISEKYKDTKVAVIEDVNHFFNTRVTSTSFRKRNSGGEAFARWMDFGADVASNLVSIASKLRDDLTIVVFAHTDIKDNGKIGMKTAGKLLDNTIDIPSYVNIMLHSVIINEGNISSYKFLTNDDGIHQAKSPAGMFAEKYIPNDLNLVLSNMEEYKKGNIKPNWKD